MPHRTSIPLPPQPNFHSASHVRPYPDSEVGTNTEFTPSELGSFHTIDDDEEEGVDEAASESASYEQHDEYDTREQNDIQSVTSSRATLSTELYEAPVEAQPRRHKSMTRKEVKFESR